MEPRYTELHDGRGGYPAAPVALDDLTDDVAEPIRAGMRARAIADACERLELPAILLDSTGRVLHVGPLAVPLVSEHLAVASDHLVGQSTRTNRCVAQAVTSAIGGSAEEHGARDDDHDDARAPLRIAGVPVRDASPFQMLKGLLVFVRREQGGEARLDALRAILAA